MMGNSDYSTHSIGGFVLALDNMTFSRVMEGAFLKEAGADETFQYLQSLKRAPVSEFPPSLPDNIETTKPSLPPLALH